MLSTLHIVGCKKRLCTLSDLHETILFFLGNDCNLELDQKNKIKIPIYLKAMLINCTFAEQADVRRGKSDCSFLRWLGLLAFSALWHICSNERVYKTLEVKDI